jgi:hypothetical protein
LLYGFRVSRPRGIGAVHAGHSAGRASLRDYRQLINPTGHNACAEYGIRLDAVAGSTVFLGIRTIQERSRGMVPLYAARVQDLGPGDVVVFRCGACGHTAELPPSALLRRLGLQPTEKVLDLERRLRCRLCHARGQAVVSIKWRALTAERGEPPA